MTIRKNLQYMVILPKDILEKKNTKNLLYIRRKLNALISGRRCCNLCWEYIGDDWENDVGKHLSAYQEYLKTIKEILVTRPNISR
jgi:hypothetical protein